MTAPHHDRGRELIPVRANTWTLWLSSALPAQLAAHLTAQPELAGGGRLFPALGDVADLLDHNSGTGRLVLPASSLPVQDVGILQRFLARGTGRELVIIDDLGMPLLDAILVLPRTRVFPLQPSAQLLAHLSSPPERVAGLPELPDEATHELAAESSDRLALSWQVLQERLADRADLAPLLDRLEGELRRTGPDPTDPTGPQSELVDLGDVAEELLAGISLERDSRMRFLFRPDGELSMRASRSSLEVCLRNLFSLVGGCSSPDCVIRVRVTSTSGSEAAPDSPVDTTIEFPDDPLAGLPLGAELDPEVVARHIGPDVSASLRNLRSAASSLGADLESLPTRPGRRRLRLRMPRMIPIP